METPELNWVFLIVQLINIALLISWVVLSVMALLALRRSQLADATRWLWAIFIIAVPLVGAVAFLLVRPGLSQPTAQTHKD